MIRAKLLLVSILVCSACVRSDREPTYEKPASAKLLGIVPYDSFKAKPYQAQPFNNMPGADKNDSYAQGYQAGCQTMSSAVGEGFYRVHGPKIDPEKLTADAWYLRGYNDGATACTFVFDWELH